MMAYSGLFTNQQNPHEMLSSLRQEMTLIKVEEMFLKKQILSLNDQFHDLMSSVAKLYPDILNEDFAKKPEKNLLQIIEHDTCEKHNDSYQKTDKKSRWNEWREEKAKRRSFTAGEVESQERNLSKPGDAKRPSSLLVGEFNGRDALSPDQGQRRRSSSESRPETLRSPGEYGTRLAGIDSERRRRIRQRLKESRNKLDIVPLGSF